MPRHHILILSLLLLAGCPKESEPDDTGESTTAGTDLDGDGYEASEDCDDGDAAVHPEAEERCNGRDDDCDGESDEGVILTFWADADADGWGDPTAPSAACSLPSGHVENALDCDDTDASVHPAAEEICNERDDDCDGTVDDGATTTFYQDRDGDGWGDPEHSHEACAPPTGFTDNGQDCDDEQAAVHPEAEEVCDGLDNDCDEAIDEEVTTTYFQDWDGDGWGDSEHPVRACSLPSGCAENDQDCDDEQAAVHPGAEELCDGLDDDCDGGVDEDDASDASTWYADLDGDGFGDDATAHIACAPPSGWIAAAGDCDDTAPAVNPAATETCDGLDDDCDGGVDEDDAEGAPTWYRDLDEDGWGDDAVPQVACAQPSGYVAVGGDCDDAEETISPAAEEFCDGVDTDCDGVVDEDDASDAPTWYRDGDGDGWGVASGATVACTGPSGAVAAAGDCDDADPAVNPAAEELCDGLDTDCDGTVDEGDASDAATWFADADGDGFGDPAAWITACTRPSGYLPQASAVTDTDCDDSDPDVFPGSSAPELPGDGVDTNCDGYDGCTDLNCDGWPDLVLPGHRAGSTGSYSATTNIYYFTGFGFSSSYRTALSTSGATAGIPVDLDQDGFVDLLSLEHYDGSTYELDSSVYWGSETGLDSSDVLALPTLGAIDAATADLDGDGWLDVVVANYRSDSGYDAGSYLYWGGPAGYSDADREILPTSGSVDVEISDLDGDGWLDIVFADYRSSAYDYTTDSYVYWGSAAGYSDADRTALPTNGARQVLVHDTNGDGWDDLVFTCHRSDTTTSTSSYVYYGSAAGYSATNRDALPTVGALSAALGDLDADGHPDLVFADYDSGTSCSTSGYIYWGASGGYTRAGRSTVPAGAARDVAISDLDHDGWDDLVFAVYSCGGYATDSFIYWNDGTGSFSSADRTALGTVGAVRVAVADLDLDGWEDLVFNHYTTGSTWDLDSYVYYNTSGVFSDALRDELPASGPWGPAGIAGAE